MLSSDTNKPSGRSLDVAFIFEYARPGDDWMMTSLVDSLKAARPGISARYVSGVFGTYSPGGLNLRRLVNLLWVYIQAPVSLVWRRPDIVIVRSSPPGIQVWAAWWASLRGTPVLCWLMDYHPEIEARLLEGRGLYRRSSMVVQDVDSIQSFKV